MLGVRRQLYLYCPHFKLALYAWEWRISSCSSLLTCVFRIKDMILLALYLRFSLATGHIQRKISLSIYHPCTIKGMIFSMHSRQSYSLPGTWSSLLKGQVIKIKFVVNPASAWLYLITHLYWTSVKRYLCGCRSRLMDISLYNSLLRNTQEVTRAGICSQETANCESTIHIIRNIWSSAYADDILCGV